MSSMIKVDLHVHSTYSHDSLISPQDIIFYSKKAGLAAVAITDHNKSEGAKRIAREIEFLIIPGVEISSQHGHIIGLNLQESIPRGLSVNETVDRIHDSGGIAIACHPFVPFKGSLGKHTCAKFDAVETINASAFPFTRSVRKAKNIADILHIPCVAGTDAHYGPAIGYAYTMIDSEPSVEAIVKAISDGKCKPFGKPIPFRLRFEKLFQYLKRKI